MNPVHESDKLLFASTFQHSSTQFSCFICRFVRVVLVTSKNFIGFLNDFPPFPSSDTLELHSLLSVEFLLSGDLALRRMGHNFPENSCSLNSHQLVLNLGGSQISKEFSHFFAPVTSFTSMMFSLHQTLRSLRVSFSFKNVSASRLTPDFWVNTNCSSGCEMSFRDFADSLHHLAKQEHR